MKLQVEIQDLRRMLNEKCKEIISDKKLAHEFYVRICEIEEDNRFTIVDDKEERKRMLSWLSKFCRHIDNGDKWLTDEENLEFFREKMKQQFGWFAD